MSIQPFWLSADLQAFDLPGLNVPYHTFVTQAAASVTTALQPVRDVAAQTATVVGKLKDWYTPRIQDTVDTAQALDSAAAGLVEDVWSTGVYAYLTLPDYGGFSYVARDLRKALVANDSNAPHFGDSEWVGGVVIMMAGGPAQIATACGALVMLFGGSSALMTDGLAKLFAAANPMAPLVDDLQQLASVPQALWSREQSQLSSWWSASPLAHLVPDGFPANLLNDALGALSPPTFTVTPTSVPFGEPFTLTISCDDAHRVGPDVALRIHNTFYTDAQRALATSKSWDIAADAWKNFDALAGDTLVVDLVDGGRKGFPVVQAGLGHIAVDPGTNLGQSLLSTDLPLFETWRSLTAGAAANDLLGGATSIARKAVETLDGVGALAKAGGDLLTRALDSAAEAATGAAATITDATTDMASTVASHLDELGKLSASTLVIPPGQGGVHQLGWALSQGLSEFAINAPLVTDDQVAIALFVCAGGPDAATVISTLKLAGTTLGIAPLAHLAL